MLLQANDIGLNIYVDVKREMRNIIIQRDWLRNDKVKYKVNGLSFIVSENNTCIDSYKQEVGALIQKYSELGVDGFVINDLPCCIVFPQYFLEKCSFDTIYSFRHIARKFGKPSAIIYRPKPSIYGSSMKELSKYNYTFFDGIIRFIKLTSNGNIEVPKLSQIKHCAFQHDIWTIVTENPNMVPYAPYLSLLQTIVGFSKGSGLIKGGYKYNENIKQSNEDSKLKDFEADLYQTNFLSKIKDISANSSCLDHDSLFVPEYSDEGIYLAVSKLKNQMFSHCVLVVNLGVARTDVNMRAHFDDMETKFVQAITILIVRSSGLKLVQKENKNQVITVDPKTAMLLKIKRGFKH